MSEKKLSRRSSTSDSESSSSSSSDSSESESTDDETKTKSKESDEKGLKGKGSQHSNCYTSSDSTDENVRSKKKRKPAPEHASDSGGHAVDEVDSDDFSPLKKLGKFSASIPAGSSSLPNCGSGCNQSEHGLPSELSKFGNSFIPVPIKQEKTEISQGAPVFEGLAMKTRESLHLLPDKHLAKEKVGFHAQFSNDNFKVVTPVSKLGGMGLERDFQIPVIKSEPGMEEFEASKSIDGSSRSLCRSSSTEPCRFNTDCANEKRSTMGSTIQPQQFKVSKTALHSSETDSSSNGDSRSSMRKMGVTSAKTETSRTLPQSTSDKKTKQNNSSSSPVRGHRCGASENSPMKNRGSSSEIMSKSRERGFTLKEKTSKPTNSRSPAGRSSSCGDRDRKGSRTRTRSSGSHSRAGISKSKSSSETKRKISVEKIRHRSRSVEKVCNKRDQKSSSVEKNNSRCARISCSSDRRFKNHRSVSGDMHYRTHGMSRNKRERSNSRSRSPRKRETKSASESKRHNHKSLSKRSRSRSPDCFQRHVLKPSQGTSRSRSRGSSYRHQDSKSSHVTFRRRASPNSLEHERSSNHTGEVKGKKANECFSDNKVFKFPDEKSGASSSGHLSRQLKEQMNYDSLTQKKHISDFQKNSDSAIKNSSTPKSKHLKIGSALQQLKESMHHSKDKKAEDSSFTDSSNDPDVRRRRRKKKSKKRKSSKKSKKKKHKKSKKDESRKKFDLKEKSKSSGPTPMPAPGPYKSAAQDTRKRGPDQVNQVLIEESKRYAPKSQLEWEKEQSVIRKVVDEQTGRVRLVKGSGEVIESIVSKQQHKVINKAATQEDGFQFQLQLQSRLK